MLQRATQFGSGSIEHTQLLNQFSSRKWRDEAAKRQRYACTHFSINYTGKTAAHLFQHTRRSQYIVIIYTRDYQVMGIVSDTGSQRAFA